MSHFSGRSIKVEMRFFFSHLVAERERVRASFDFAVEESEGFNFPFEFAVATGGAKHLDSAQWNRKRLVNKKIIVLVNSKYADGLCSEI